MRLLETGQTETGRDGGKPSFFGKNFAINALYGILNTHYRCKMALAVIENMGETMLNQERVCEMTKLAIFDRKEGRECRPMIQYFHKDYIGKELLKSFITGTIAFILIAGIAGLYLMEDLLDQMGTIDIPQMAVRIGVCYGACMAVYFAATYIIYHIRYTRGRQAVKKYYLHLKKVNKIYNEEEGI